MKHLHSHFLLLSKEKSVALVDILIHCYSKKRQSMQYRFPKVYNTQSSGWWEYVFSTSVLQLSLARAIEGGGLIKPDCFAPFLRPPLRAQLRTCEARTMDTSKWTICWCFIGILLQVCAADEALKLHLGRSVLGDPGMKSDKVRVAVEGWNFCNRVGYEDPNAPSPRWADCTDIHCKSPDDGTLNFNCGWSIVAICSWWWFCAWMSCSKGRAM